MEKFDIIKIEEKEVKAELTKQILSTLPEWFGDKEAVSNYAENVKNLHLDKVFVKEIFIKFT